MAMAQEDPLTQDLNCPICLEPMHEPVTLSDCHHSFCRRCLQQSIQGALGTDRDPYVCPQCRSPFVPSDGSRVNHHLQSILNSHRRAQERIASAETTEKPSKQDIDNLTSFLSTVDTKLQSLLTTLDQSSIRVGGRQTVRAQRVQVHPRPSVEQVNGIHPSNTQEHNIDCDFEAESVGEFRDRSLGAFCLGC
ncbi:E3 ubiquitin-protein ligase TRIM58-like isoform X2 [Haliotis rufescens]|uniref:E3 ubiquitin-protein ligase TRIM58-like isoform X2 n=1 Tax=Haliotis rufescens TaxID=6454 RepID=UPI00201EFB50|nr:E3 ubiquitin-protein ligase TRIM58-like isoform X2 [Haliotis rufescens]